MAVDANNTNEVKGSQGVTKLNQPPSEVVIQLFHRYKSRERGLYVLAFPRKDTATGGERSFWLLPDVVATSRTVVDGCLCGSSTRLCEDRLVGAISDICQPSGGVVRGSLGALTMESTTAVTLLGLHLLVDEPKCVLKEKVSP